MGWGEGGGSLAILMVLWVVCCEDGELGSVGCL